MNHDIELAKVHAALSDPVSVHINMMRGTIAKPSLENIHHLYPEIREDQRKARAAIAAAEAAINRLDQERDGFAGLCAVRTSERDDAREQAESFKAMYRQACDWRDAKIAELEARATAAEAELQKMVGDTGIEPVTSPV